MSVSRVAHCIASAFHPCLPNAQVDTGWVTDNAPGGRGAVARAHETHVAPPLDDNDGASRAPRAKRAAVHLTSPRI